MSFSSHEAICGFRLYLLRHATSRSWKLHGYTSFGRVSYDEDKEKCLDVHINEITTGQFEA